jgi:hypothetical protein
MDESKHRARIAKKMDFILSDRPNEFVDQRTGDPRFTWLGEEVMDEECEDPKYCHLDEEIYFEESTKAFKRAKLFHD